MDIFLLIGIITGLLTLIVGMILKGANVAVLLNPAAIVIIFVGTTAAVINSFPICHVFRTSFSLCLFLL